MHADNTLHNLGTWPSSAEILQGDYPEWHISREVDGSGRHSDWVAQHAIEHDRVLPWRLNCSTRRRFSVTRRRYDLHEAAHAEVLRQLSPGWLIIRRQAHPRGHETTRPLIPEGCARGGRTPSLGHGFHCHTHQGKDTR